MLCLSTPAAPSLAQTFSQAASSVAGAQTLSIKLNQRPPLTPLTSADTIRSVHTKASAFDRSVSISSASAPCLALAGTAGAPLSCSGINLPFPPSCPPSLRTVLLAVPLTPPVARRRCQYYEGSDS